MTGTSSAVSQADVEVLPTSRASLWGRAGQDEAARLRVLLVGSGGGHWVQLMRVASAFADHDRSYVTTVEGCEEDVGGARVYLVADANRWKRFALLKLAFRMLLVLLRERPDVVVSTGAAPGYFALRFGKLFGAHTIWLDSVANVDRLSLSGQLVESYADLWLTQWPHLSRPGGPIYEGAVL